MEEHSIMRPRLYFLFLVTCITISSVTGNPAHIVSDPKSDNDYGYSYVNNDSLNLNNMSGCIRDEFAIKDVIFLNNTDIFLKSLNITVHSSDYYINNETVSVCLIAHNGNKKKLITECKDKFFFESHEFQILSNRSALLFGDIIDPEEYELRGLLLYICASDDDSDESGNFTSSGWTLDKASIYVGQIGSGISIVALILHLLTFCFLPSLKNLPGYNLASLSVAFLFAYSFVLIGQIPQVLGAFCVVSAILQQNFFLAAFFCMNVMAFDVWRTLKLATEKFIVSSNNVRKRQYLWYSLYAWGCPCIISTISVLFDNIEGVPEKLKPYYGLHDTCWMNGSMAKLIFFAIPALTLCVINGIFFVSSARMIFNNTMRNTNDQTKKSVQLNYILYVRLALMMGLTWLVGVIALISKDSIVWLIHDLLNSLQGLFLFLLFTCTRKVIRHISGKTTFRSYSSEKNSMQTSKISTIKLESQ